MSALVCRCVTACYASRFGGDHRRALRGSLRCCFGRGVASTVPDVRVAGMGTRRLAGAGVDLLADADGLAVMGFFPVIARLPELSAWSALGCRHSRAPAQGRADDRLSRF